MKLGSHIRFDLYCLTSEIYRFRHKIAARLRKSLQFTANIKIHGLRESRDFGIALDMR